MSTKTRQPKGLPIGGRFAATQHSESDVILAEAHSAAQRAVEKAFEAGITEGARRARGEKHRDLSEVMDLSGVTFDDSHTDVDFALDDPFAEPAPGTAARTRRPAPRPAGTGVQCFRCLGSGIASDSSARRDIKCPQCDATGEMAATPPGQDTVEVPGYDAFHRLRDGLSAGTPNAMRFEASRALTDDEAQRLAQLVGYRYAATVRGEPLGWPDRDSERSFCVSADSTKSRCDDLGVAFEEFEDDLDALIREGSPVRTTNRKGAGTKGTRLVDGLGDPDLTIAIYYDDVFEGSS